MANYGLTFHHLGLAVREPRHALTFLRGQGYTCGETVRDDQQNVNLIMCTHPEAPDVEIVYPTEAAGPLEGILKQGREMVYHTCYRTDDLTRALDLIEADVGRALCVSPPKSATLFGDQAVSFYYLEGVGLLEILEAH